MSQLDEYYDPEFGIDGKIQFESKSGLNLYYTICTDELNRIYAAAKINDSISIYRFDSVGNIDLDYGNNGKSSFAVESLGTGIQKMLINDEGKQFVFYSVASNLHLFCINEDGTVNTDFGDNGKVEIFDTFIQFVAAGIQDNYLYVAWKGYSIQDPDAAQFKISRFDYNGFQDTNYLIHLEHQQGDYNLSTHNTSVIVYDSGDLMALYRLDKWVNDNLEDIRYVIKRFNSDGVVDESFGENGVIDLDFDYEVSNIDLLYAVNNSIYVGGTNYNKDFFFLEVDYNNPTNVYEFNGISGDGYSFQSLRKKMFSRNSTMISLETNVDTFWSNYNLFISAFDSNFERDLNFGDEGKIRISNWSRVDDITINKSDDILVVARDSTNINIVKIPLETVSNVKPENINHGISISPNPVTDILNIEVSNLDLPNSKFVIYDINGNQIKSISCNNSSSNCEIDVSDFSPGIYICSLLKDSKLQATQKFVKM